MRFAVHQFFLGILALHMFGFGAGNSIPFELAPENNIMDADLENVKNFCSNLTLKWLFLEEKI